MCNLKPRHLHYKVCSTFDSSPELGSIGKAIDVGIRETNSSCIPLVVGAPSLGRFSVFGNLFANSGIGQDGSIYRLDRHPNVSNHPTTPMRESDLREHLSKQTDASIGLFNILQLSLPDAERRRIYNELVNSPLDVVLFDTLSDEHLGAIGSLIDNESNTSHPQFSVGSSAIEMALTEKWCTDGTLNQKTDWEKPEELSQVLVISGSCSPVTQSQISWAVEHGGFEEVVINTPEIIANEGSPKMVSQIANQTIEILKSGKSAIVHTSKGINDPRFVTTEKTSDSTEHDPDKKKAYISQLLGTSLGFLLIMVLESTNIQRICIAGGDTTSLVVETMEIEALEMISPFVPGAPLCRFVAPQKPYNGIEATFKGGQVGRKDFFGALVKGCI